MPSHPLTDEELAELQNLAQGEAICDYDGCREADCKRVVKVCEELRAARAEIVELKREVERLKDSGAT